MNVIFLMYSWKYFKQINRYQEIPKDCTKYDFDIAKQQMEEIESCKELEIPYFLLMHSEATKDNEIFYKEQPISCYEYELFDSCGRKCGSLSQDKCILRSDFYEAKKCLSYIENIGGKNLISWKEEKKTHQWYKYILPQFTQRKIKSVSCEEITCELLQKYAKEDKVFIKTEFKEVSFVAYSDLRDFEQRFILDNLDNDRKMIISEPLKLYKDEEGTLEYRAWVVDKKVSNISRCSNLPHSVPQEVIKLAKDFAILHSEIFPLVYTVDFGIDRNLGVVVIELNPFVSCGRYANNCFRKFLCEASFL